MTSHYTTIGDVCGACDHRHQTPQAAQACADRHHRAIQRGNPGGHAYSDRYVYATHPDGRRVRYIFDDGELSD